MWNSEENALPNTQPKALQLVDVLVHGNGDQAVLVHHAEKVADAVVLLTRDGHQLRQRASFGWKRPAFPALQARARSISRERIC